MEVVFKASPRAATPRAIAPNPRAAASIKGAPRTRAPTNTPKAIIFSRLMDSNIKVRPSVSAVRVKMSPPAIRAKVPKGTITAAKPAARALSPAASGTDAELIAAIPSATIGRSK